MHTSSKGDVENNRESLLKAIREKPKFRTKEEQVMFDEKMKAGRQQKENCKTET
ncbi:hypothetical protein [Wolbachia pipientis]|uniref:hypothetical protein n=1 Tax=Wolbachia pipientis TaxID=955 RepID=UPI0025A444ED|nr:hypothetical protein [Wolbachia pipientis]MDM8335327.1 hypothetical protein [Wolbachia pipientis]